ncbi:MAG: hypothetical protein NVSMB52_19160 [Chloroflexota bacterium]
MTGRSVHDMLLRVLRDSAFRELVLDQSDAAAPEEWRVIRGVSKGGLTNVARFLARHYYAERMVRLFRHIRRLSPLTSRDPWLVLDSSRAQVILAHAVVGSHQTAEDLVSCIEEYLLENDSAIRLQCPYWRDLVRYHATMFRLEACRETQRPTSFPCRSVSARIVEFEWDLPAIITALQSSLEIPTEGKKIATKLLISACADQQVATHRCSSMVQHLFNAADGATPVEEMGRHAGLSRQDTEQTLEQMKAIGSIQWQRPMTDR